MNSKHLILVGLLVLVSTASVIPQSAVNVDAYNPTLIPLGKDVNFTGDGGAASTVYIGWVQLNVSDVLYVNWTKGTVNAGQRFDVEVHTMYTTLNFTNMYWQDQFPAYYIVSYSGFQMAPGNSNLVSPVSALIKIDIKAWGNLNQQTVKVDVKQHHEPGINLAPIYDALDGLNDTINALNQTVRDLTNRTNGFDSQITNILRQIENLKTGIENNSVNISVLRTEIETIQKMISALQSTVNNMSNAINVTNVTYVTNVTNLNQSLINITKELNSLNVTVNNITVPDDSKNITSLQTENSKLKKDLAALQIKVASINTTQEVINKSNYINTTDYKNTTQHIDPLILESAIPIGTVFGIIGGGAAGWAMSNRKKKDDGLGEMVPQEIPVAKAKKMPDNAPKEDVKDGDDLDALLNSLEKDSTKSKKKNIKSKTADSETESAKDDNEDD
jgi:peptidoglycan hydrolase CwlO-like protein